MIFSYQKLREALYKIGKGNNIGNKGFVESKTREFYENEDGKDWLLRNKNVSKNIGKTGISRSVSKNKC